MHWNDTEPIRIQPAILRLECAGRVQRDNSARNNAIACFAAAIAVAAFGLVILIIS